MGKLLKNRFSSIIIVFVITLIYSVLRYNIFNGVSWTDLPIFVLNKSISLSAVILLMLSTIDRATKKPRFQIDKAILLIFISTHVLLSLLILGPEYYGKFYQGLKLNIIGNFTILAGVLAYIGILFVNISTVLTKLNIFHRGALSRGVVTRLNQLFLGLHLLVMGFGGWLTPGKWPGYMPPISLVAFSIYLIAIIVNISTESDK